MRSLIVLIMLFGTSALAFEIGPIGAYTNTSESNYTGNFNTLKITSSGGSGYGGGVDGMFPLSKEFDLEIRAMYVSDQISNSFTGTATGTQVMTVNYFQFPVLLNVHLGEKFAIHAGGFYNVATGNVTLATTVGGVTTTTSNTTNSINDYGAIGGLEVRLPLGQKSTFLISADYLAGFANMNANTAGATSTTTASIEGLLGVLFNM